MKKVNHTFAICAYKDNPYVEECIKSLMKQSVESVIILATSTPSPFLAALAKEYNLQYAVNPTPGGGIAADWEFAISQAKSAYCTIAHQDDIYEMDYAEKVCDALDRRSDAIIAFTNYGDLIGDKVESKRLYLYVKRLLLWPFMFKRSLKSRFMKRLILRFGCPICCPSVTYNLRNLNPVKFDTSYSVNLDWSMWWRLTEVKGAFVYCRELLMLHRISESMETSNAISDSRREQEDLRMFRRMWPEFIVRGLMFFYRKSYSSNQ